MIKYVFLSLIMLSLSACSNTSIQYKPVRLSKAEQCSLCGMIIMNYPGPHAQIAWKNGKHTFYCDLFEVMPMVLNTPDRQRMGEIFVQDFSHKKWGSYSNSWIPAQKAYYIINSHQRDAMGISYVPFKTQADAKTFQSKHGGTLLNFAQMTQQVVAHSYALMREKPDEYGPSFTQKNPVL